jgi:cytosine/adenosine deaminase-related metal-dependent hydrolase
MFEASTGVPASKRPGRPREGSMTASNRSFEYTRSEAETAKAFDLLVGSPSSGGTRILLRGGTVLTMDPSLGDFPRGDVLIENDTIIDIGPDLSAAAHDGQAVVIPAEGTIVMPGMHDAHRHCWQTHFRRVVTGVELPTYIEVMLETISPLYRPEDVYIGTLVAAAGALESGVTCLLDFSHNSRSAEHSDRAIEALREAGIRGVHASGPPLHGAWDEQWPADLERLRDQHFGAVSPLLSLRSGLLGNDLVGGEFYSIREESLAVAAELGLEVSVDACWRSETDLNLAPLARKDLLGPHITLLHATDLSDETWRVIADTGTQVALCPTSDAQLGIAGAVPPIDKALELGIAPALCVDIECSLGTDLFAQMQAVYTIQRMSAYRRAYDGDETAPDPISARTVLEMATVNGAYANGVNALVGSLSPGMQADIVMLDAENVTNMPLGNAVANVVVGAGVKDVDTVLVAGTVKKWGGSLVGFNLPAMRQAIHESRDYLLERGGFTLNIATGLIERTAPARS